MLIALVINRLQIIFFLFSTAKILLFYVVFYAVLAGFFAAMLAVFWQTLDENKPKWQLDNGLIGSNPGLGFRPMPPESNVESTLVWFEASDSKNTEYWIGALDEFLLSKFWKRPLKIKINFLNFLAYTDVKKEDEKNRVECDKNSPPQNGKVCRVDVTPSQFGICTKEQNYGYPKSSPCVFLKLNKVRHFFAILFNLKLNFVFSDLRMVSSLLQQDEWSARLDAEGFARQDSRQWRQRSKF